MPEREVRYCTAEDGVRIAYCVEGEGNTTILALPVFNETFSLDHLMPVYKQFYRDLGAGRRVIRFDWRGTGLSDIVSLANELAELDRDMEAVVRSAGAEKYVLWSSTTTGPSAIRFAANHPDLVSHLILYGTYAATADAFSESLVAGLVALAAADWHMASQAIADMNGRKEFPEEAGQLGEWYYRSFSSERFLSRAQATREIDAGALLPDVHTPTLVLHRIADPTVPLSAGQKLAAGIPGARFVPLEGQGHLFCLGEYSAILTAVDAFLADRVRGPAEIPEALSSAFRTVLFTDLVGHTEMMQRLGDEQGRALLREHERITREVLKEHGGTEVKTMGDGFMASFGSVTKAVQCAVALQKAFDVADLGGHDHAPLRVRVGINAGEPIAEDGDLFGSTVILAARVAAQAGAGEILIPEPVRHLLAGKEFLFSDRGDVALKGFEDPVRLYEVRWRD